MAVDLSIVLILKLSNTQNLYNLRPTLNNSSVSYKQKDFNFIISEINDINTNFDTNYYIISDSDGLADFTAYSHSDDFVKVALDALHSRSIDTANIVRI